MTDIKLKTQHDDFFFFFFKLRLKSCRAATKFTKLTRWQCDRICRNSLRAFTWMVSKMELRCLLRKLRLSWLTKMSSQVTNFRCVIHGTGSNNDKTRVPWGARDGAGPRLSVSYEWFIPVKAVTPTCYTSLLCFNKCTVLMCSNRRHQCEDVNICAALTGGSIHRLRTMNHWTYTNPYISVKSGSRATQYWLL